MAAADENHGREGKAAAGRPEPSVAGPGGPAGLNRSGLLADCWSALRALTPARLALGRELGATHTVNPDKESAVDAIKAITGAGVNFTLDTTGNMKVLRQAMDVLAPRGTCGFVGGAPAGAAVTIDVEQIMVGGRTTRGIIEGDSNPDIFLPKLIDLFMLGRFPFDKLVKFYPFEAINTAVDDALSGRTVKPILRFPTR